MNFERVEVCCDILRIGGDVAGRRVATMEVVACVDTQVGGAERWLLGAVRLSGR